MKVYCSACIIRHSDRMGLSVLLHKGFRKRIVVASSRRAYRRVSRILICFSTQVIQNYMYMTTQGWIQSTRWAISLRPRTDQSAFDIDLATIRDLTSLRPLNSVSMRCVVQASSPARMLSSACGKFNNNNANCHASCIWSDRTRKAWKVVEGREETQSTMK